MRHYFALDTNVRLDSDIGALARGYTAAVYTEATQPAEAELEGFAPAAAAAAAVNIAEDNVPEIEAGAESLTIREGKPNGLANGNDLSISQEWVDVKAPQDAAPPAAAPVETPNARSWADDQPEGSTAVSKLMIDFFGDAN